MLFFYKILAYRLIHLILTTICILRVVESAELSKNGSLDKNEQDLKTLALSIQDSTSNETVLLNKNSIITPTKARQPPPKVKLYKCCRIGEYLNSEQVCVAGTSQRWVPTIYLPLRRVLYEPQGESPKFMTFEENIRPEIPQESDSDEKEQRCKPNDLEMFTGNSNKIVLFANGSLLIKERSKFINPKSFCVDREAALVCFGKPKIPSPELKLKKCCGTHGIYDLEARNCVLTPEQSRKLMLPLNDSHYETHYGFPECPDKGNSFAIAGNLHEAYFHNETGHVKLPHVNLSAVEYCLEHIREEITNMDNPTVKIIACHHHFAPKHPQNTISSKVNIGNNRNQVQAAALNIGIIISVIFLAATLVAGYLMPSVHHVLHWRCQIYYVFCLFIGDSLLAYSLLSNSLKEVGSVPCLMVASTMHFFFLSAFFWLNTMCFNIWWTFRDFRPSSLERNQEVIRLRLYSAYAWGIPLVISVIAATVNLLPETQLLRPGFGERSCWFNGEHLAIFAYFFGPVGVLLIANIILFISTTHQLTCGLWKRDDVKTTTEKTALGKVCLKLVVVMGVTWIADVISWLVGGPDTAWFFTDLINALQGVFIFIVVGCQPQVWTACKRFCCPKLRQEITNTTNGVQHSSSSHGLPSLAACGGEVTQNTSVTNTTVGVSNNLNNTQTKIPMETVC